MAGVSSHGLLVGGIVVLDSVSVLTSVCGVLALVLFVPSVGGTVVRVALVLFVPSVTDGLVGVASVLFVPSVGSTVVGVTCLPQVQLLLLL